MAPDPADSSEELVFRRGKLRKRDDYAVNLFKQALALLADARADPEPVKRILVELGRFYDPVTNGPVLDPPTRRQVVELLETGRREEAHQVLDGRLRAYTRLDRPEAPAPGAGEVPGQPRSRE